MKAERQKWYDFLKAQQGVEVKDLPKGKKTKVQKEGMLQSKCVEWFRLQYPTLLLVSSVNGAVLQGTKEQRARRWKILEKEGALPGTSDLFLFFPAGGFHGLCIEMKVEGGAQQKNQKEFQAKVESFGYKYVLCKSFDQFQTEVNNYLNGRTNNKLGNGQIFDSK